LEHIAADETPVSPILRAVVGLVHGLVDKRGAPTMTDLKVLMSGKLGLAAEGDFS
jgi:hypothetical protein